MGKCLSKEATGSGGGGRTAEPGAGAAVASLAFSGPPLADNNAGDAALADYAVIAPSSLLPPRPPPPALSLPASWACYLETNAHRAMTTLVTTPRRPF